MALKNYGQKSLERCIILESIEIRMMRNTYTWGNRNKKAVSFRKHFFHSAMGRLIDCRKVPSWVCTHSKPYKDPNSKIGYHLYTTRFYCGGER